MQFAVFDTNVIVSAGLKPNSPPALLVTEWAIEGNIRLSTCPSVIAEYYEVTSRPKFARYNFPPQWLDFLIRTSRQLPEPAPWPLDLPDPKDAPFLALAHASGAWLVTGNLKHFPRSARRGVTVISPSEYLERLGAG
jgi:putative PIN family toxin of toxin-antitoxin system